MEMHHTNSCGAEKSSKFGLMLMNLTKHDSGHRHFRSMCLVGY